MNRAILDDRRVVLGGTALLVIVMLALGWFVGIGPQLASADDLATQQADTETQYSVLQAKIADLSEQQDRMSVLEAGLVTAQDGLPSTTALPAFTRQVTRAADAADVTLGDLSISAPTGAVVDGAAPDPATTTDGGAATAGGPQAIEVSLTSTGSFAEQAAFVKSLQDGDRRALISSTQMTVGGQARTASIDGETTMTTQVTIFTNP